MLLTGRHPIRVGTVPEVGGELAIGETTIAEGFKANGYRTGIFGKWHNLDFRPQDGGYTDDLVTRYAIDFIREHKDRAFFCYVPFHIAHAPLQAKQNDLAAIDPATAAQLPAASEKVTDEEKRIHAAMLHAMDENVAAIVAELDKLGLSENTILVFTSDNGAMEAGSSLPLRGHKHTIYDGGVRLPTVIHWPEGGLVGGGKWDGLCGSLDMFPTLMAMTGSTMPQTRPLDGKNIWPALRDGQKSPVESDYWVWRDEDAIRTDKAQPKDRLAIAVANWSGTQYATDWIEFDIAFSPDAPKRRPYFSPLEGNNQKPFGPLFKPGTGVDQLGRDQSTGPAIADGESTWEHRIVGLSSTAPGPLGKHGVVFTGGTAGTFTVYLNQHSPPRLHREPGIRLPALHVGVLFAFPYQRGLRQNSIYKSMLQGAAGCLEQAAPATASSSALDC